MVRAQWIPVLMAALLSSLLTLVGTQVLAPPSSSAAQVSDGTASVVRTQRVEIVDATGTVRAVLGTTPGGDAAGVIFRDEDGRERAGMGTGRPAWGVGPGGWVLDGNGRLRAAWGLAPDDAAAAFLVADETGRRRVGLGGASAVGYGVVVADETGQPRVGMGGLPGSDPSYGMRVRDAAGNPRVALSAGTDSASLSVLDASGRTVWRAP